MNAMQQRLIDIPWDAFERLPIEAKAPYLAQTDGLPFHTLFAQQFDAPLLDRLATLANAVRAVAKSRAGVMFLRDLVCHKRAMLYFSQPSSRTFLSFLSACQILGLQVGEVRDTATSSEFKGESREDSVRTFSSYFDLIVMRTPEKGLAERMAWMLSNSERPVPIINAGSGKDQHPTQALLDVYTLQRSFERRGGIDGKTVVFVGDLLRGRTVRSLASLLTNYRNVKQCFVAPKELQIGEDILQQLHAAGVTVELSGDFESLIPKADAIYMTRIQDEWDTEARESRKLDIQRFFFAERHLALLKPDAVIMHPFPRRQEISTGVDHDPRAVYWRQMRNGMWIRAALMAWLFRKEQQVHEFHERAS
jgi:aspartate carbamoyltransferase catalytic subunit